MQRIVGLLAFVLFICASPQIALAEEFEQFAENEWQGWIEETNQGGRIKLLPFVAQPGNASYWSQGDFGRFGMGITSQGNLRFGYRIIAQSQYIPPALKSRIAHISGRDINAFNRYPISFVRARIAKVQLFVDGELFGEHVYNGAIVSGNTAREFTIPIDDYDTINAIREGNFYLQTYYTFPLSSYSSASVRYDAQLVSNSWFRAVKEIVEKKRRSGFSFGPIDFSREIRRTYVRESSSSGGYNRQRENFTVLLVDPTPEQIKMVDEMLGFARTTATEARQRHAAAHAAAIAAGNPDLAQAHTLYAQALDISGEQNGEFQKALLELLGKMKEADVMTFMAAGFKSTNRSASGYYRYERSATTNTSTEARLNFSSFVVKNAMVGTVANTLPEMRGQAYTPLDAAFMANDNRIFPGGLYGVVQPSNWAEGVARAIDQRRWGDVDYALSRRFTRATLPTIDANRKLISGDYLIHRAVQSGNLEVVRKILNLGGDPTRTNSYGEDASDLALAQRRTNIVQLVNDHLTHSGRFTIKIKHEGLSTGDFYIINPTKVRSIRKVSDTQGETELQIEDFPGTYQFQFQYNYSAVVPNSMLSQLRFRYQVLAQNAQYAQIQAEGHIWLNTILRRGQPQTRELELAWRGPLSGWSTDPKAEATAAQAASSTSQPFSFDFSN